jgi:hypothetical protein
MSRRCQEELLADPSCPATARLCRRRRPADAAAVLVEDDIADPVGAVLDRPVVLDPGGEGDRGCDPVDPLPERGSDLLRWSN